MLEWGSHTSSRGEDAARTTIARIAMAIAAEVILRVQAVYSVLKAQWETN